MKKVISSVLLLALATAVQGNDFLRNLQAPPTTTQGPPQNGTMGPPQNGTMGPPRNGTQEGRREIPKSYGENVTIPFNATLGCGACIRGGYIYCIPGAEGSDPTTWGVNRAVCCRDKNNCTALTNKIYNCSTKYTSTILAKAMCPFRKNSCGNNTAFGFDSVGQQQSINISLAQGETCTFQVQADCGLPTFKPNDTTGFDIETVDYDEDDLQVNTANATKAQQMPPPPQNGNNGTRPANGTNGTMPGGPGGQGGPQGPGGQGGQQGPGGQGGPQGQGGQGGPKKTEFGMQQRPPMPSQNMEIMNRRGPGGQGGPQGQGGQGGQGGQKQGGKDGEPIRGPQAARFDPTLDGSERKFKGGEQNGKNDTLCKKRYSQIAITALGNLTASSSRLLQAVTNSSSSAPVYTMQLTVGTSDFADSSSAVGSFVYTFAALALAFIGFTLA